MVTKKTIVAKSQTFNRIVCVFYHFFRLHMATLKNIYNKQTTRLKEVFFELFNI